jgi:hypothetical protein
MYLVESRYRTSGYEPAWDALEWLDPSAPKKLWPHRDQLWPDRDEQ